MVAAFRLVLLFLVLLVGACRSRDEAMQLPGLGPEESLNLPRGTPGHGYERVEQRPDSTPTPRPNTKMDRGLDPAGLPPGGTPTPTP